jgi:hypothetical protein
MFSSVLLWSVAMSPGSMTPRDSAAPTTRAASYHVTTDGFIMNISSGFMPPPPILPVMSEHWLAGAQQRLCQPQQQFIHSQQLQSILLSFLLFIVGNMIALDLVPRG